jgi:hypothetical protein
MHRRKAFLMSSNDAANEPCSHVGQVSRHQYKVLGSISCGRHHMQTRFHAGEKKTEAIKEPVAMYRYLCRTHLCLQESPLSLPVYKLHRHHEDTTLPRPRPSRQLSLGPSTGSPFGLYQFCRHLGDSQLWAPGPQSC